MKKRVSQIRPNSKDFHDLKKAAMHKMKAMTFYGYATRLDTTFSARDMVDVELDADIIMYELPPTIPTCAERFLEYYKREVGDPKDLLKLASALGCVFAPTADAAKTKEWLKDDPQNFWELARAVNMPEENWKHWVNVKDDPRYIVELPSDPTTSCVTVILEKTDNEKNPTKASTVIIKEEVAKENAYLFTRNELEQLAPWGKPLAIAVDEWIDKNFPKRGVGNG